MKIIKGCTRKAAAGTKTSAAALPVRIIPSERHPPALLSLSSGSAQDCRQLGQREYVHPTENRWHRFQRSSQWFLPGQRDYCDRTRYHGEYPEDPHLPGSYRHRCNIRPVPDRRRLRTEHRYFFGGSPAAGSLWAVERSKT